MIARKYISRLKQGWQVRIILPEHEIHITRSFSDNASGGKAEALKAAQTFRDEELKLYGVPLRKGRISAPRTQFSSSTTGIIGVTNRNNMWKGHCRDRKTGASNSQQFSSIKLGDCEAFTAACQYRYNQCGILKVYRGFKFPCDIPVQFEYIEERRQSDERNIKNDEE